MNNIEIVPNNNEEELILKNKHTLITNNYEEKVTPDKLIIEEEEKKEEEKKIKTLRAKPILLNGFYDENEYKVEINDKEEEKNLLDSDENKEEEKELIDNDEIKEEEKELIHKNEETPKEIIKEKEKICGCVSKEEELFRKGWTFIKISSYVASKQISRIEKKILKKWKKICGIKDQNMSLENFNVKNENEKSDL